MAIQVDNTNYNGEVLERILTVAATSNELVEKGLILDLGKAVGIDTLTATLDAIAPAQKLSSTLETAPAADDAPKAGPWELRMAEIREKLKKQ